MTDVPYSVTSISYVVTETFNTAGYLDCSQCDWWQYNERGPQTMTLNAGANRIVWRHRDSQYGPVTNEYFLNITRASAFDASTLSNLTLSNSTLTEQSGQLYKYNGTLIPGAATSTGLTATFTTGTATWANGTSNGSLTSGVASSVPVTRGHNTITVTHTAPDTTETVYTIYVDRTGIFSDIDIRTSGVTITPAFDPSIH